ncbi:L,D-transpeptidase [Aquibium microcysteis]|uniref:L,D-transpeptidase n=1 Tax=Aquibium microcysteis TaxID=675281 RepID=UPI00165D0903|nr:L,D-transpeptidase [Aquibium microcysteis]
MRITRLLVAALGVAISLGIASPAAAERDRADPGAAETIKGTQKPRADVKTKTKTAKAAEKPQPPTVSEVIAAGNNGELRSETRPADPVFSLFGAQSSKLLPQTQALDSVLEKRQKGRTFAVKNEFVPQTVPFSGYPRGTIVINTSERFLYLVESSNSARRYAIAVGREGLEFKGTAKVGDKQEWPRWIPTLDMQKREPKKYGQYKDGMPGGPDNPLGARAIYLHQNNKDTHIRIHGTNAPQTIGTNSSNGCFRMINEHVMDLYGRVPMGANVVVL